MTMFYLDFKRKNPLYGPLCRDLASRSSRQKILEVNVNC